MDGEAVGGVGFVLRHDVERVSAEIGYWLAEPFWGRGIATEALGRDDRARDRHAPADPHLRAAVRVERRVRAGCWRRAGYVLEGRLRRSAIKDGVITDQLQYAFIVPETAVSADDPPRPGTRG